MRARSRGTSGAGTWDRLKLEWEVGLRRLPFFTQRLAVGLLGLLVVSLALVGGLSILGGGRQGSELELRPPPEVANPNVPAAPGGAAEPPGPRRPSAPAQAPVRAQSTSSTATSTTLPSRRGAGRGAPTSTPPTTAPAPSTAGPTTTSSGLLPPIPVLTTLLGPSE